MLGDAQATGESLTDDGWLRTGDVGYVDAGGNRHIVDRLKQMTKYNAWQIAPSELEALLMMHPPVPAASVVGTPTAEFRRVRDEMTSMLKAAGSPPTGERWGDLRYLQPVRDYRPRHTSTLLVFDAVCDALDTVDVAGPGGTAAGRASTRRSLLAPGGW